MAGAEFHHIPALADEVVTWLTPGLERFGVFVDCTLGGGGHAARVLAASPGAWLLGIDRDSEALKGAAWNLQAYSGRTHLVHRNFEALESILRESRVEQVGACLFDLGVSSHQLDRADRGFGYRVDAPLDMRMDPSQPLHAETVVNDYPEPRLAEIIAIYGEERFARRVAKSIAQRRRQARISTTSELAETVRAAIPAPRRPGGPDRARRTFQAIRIEVNGELNALSAGLPSALDALGPGGRICVISYHSLEDRIVKREFAGRAKGCVCPPALPICTCGRGAELRILTKRPIRPSVEETTANPRARSARLRAGEKLAVEGYQ